MEARVGIKNFRMDSIKGSVFFMYIGAGDLIGDYRILYAVPLINLVMLHF